MHAHGPCGFCFVPFFVHTYTVWVHGVELVIVPPTWRCSRGWSYVAVVYLSDVDLSLQRSLAVKPVNTTQPVLCS